MRETEALSDVARTGLRKNANQYEEIKVATQGSGFALIVDDDPDFCESFAGWLRDLRSDLCVFTAFTDVEALNLVNRYRPQLVFLDINLGSTDGSDVCRKISEIKDDLQTHVVGLTGDLSVERRRQMIHAGADEIISKTANPMRFAFTVNRIMPHRQ